MKKIVLILFLAGVLIVGGCDGMQQGGIIKTTRLVNQTENQTGIPQIQIVSVPVKEVGPNPIIIEKAYLDTQLKALQLQHIIGEITLSRYLEVKEEAINDENAPNFQERIIINSEDVDTPLKLAQLDYILEKITLNEYLEKERELI